MHHHLRLLTLLLVLTFSACTSPGLAELPVPTATITAVAPTDTAIAPAPAPPEAPPSTGAPALPTTRLDPETVGRIARLRAIGLGDFVSLTLSDETLLVGTTDGIAWLRLPDLDLARFEAVGAAYDLALSPDGALLAHATPADDDRGRAILRRAANAAPIAELQGGAPRFAPGGQFLATSNPLYALAGVTWLWRAADGAPVAQLPGNAPRFSDDGRYLATVEIGFEAPSITRVYPTADSRPVLEIEGYALAFSADGSLVAVAQEAGVAVYSLPDGRQTTSLPGVVASAVAFSSDGRELLSVDGADLVVLDLTTGREQRRFAGVNRLASCPPLRNPGSAPGETPSSP